MNEFRPTLILSKIVKSFVIETLSPIQFSHSYIINRKANHLVGAIYMSSGYRTTDVRMPTLRVKVLEKAGSDSQARQI